MIEVPGNLPTGWIKATLEQIAEPTKGAITDGPFGSNLKTEHYTTSGPLVIRLQNIGEGAFKRDDSHISVEHFDRLKKHHVREGDLVVAMLGERLPRSCLVPPDIEPAIVKADCARVRLNPTLADGRYVNWFLNSSEVQRTVTAIVKGVGRPRINLGQLRQVQVDLPPLAEQRRIVAKVEELFSDLDAGVAALERVRAKLKRYRASVLNAAVTGKLTEEWRERNLPAEPAGELLVRILLERQTKWEDEQLRRFAEANKNPPLGWASKYAAPGRAKVANANSIPDRWVWATMEQASESIVDCAHSTAKFKTDGVACIDTTCIAPGRIVREDVRFVDEETFAHRTERLVPRAGDIIFAREGTVGTAVAIPEEFRCCLGQRVMLYRPARGCVPKYLETAINSDIVRRQYQPLILGTTAPHLNVRDARLLVVPLPPTLEQFEIATEVDRRLSIVDAVQNEIEHSLKRSAQLRQAILKQAFEGKLVLQDTSDEPASALLERLRSRADATPSQQRKISNGSAKRGRKRQTEAAT